jgi:hypothetical protein
MKEIQQHHDSRRNTSEMKSKSLQKTALLTSLYFTQSLPKGYLKFLPISLAEKGKSMKFISILGLLTWGDWLKPFFGVLFDFRRFSSMNQRKRIILLLQSSIIALFAASWFLSVKEIFPLAALLSISSFLASVHDTAVDGLAVKLLQSSEERSFGAFGQYFGHKLGLLFSSGFLPIYFGSNHQTMTVGLVSVMSLVLLYTWSFPFTAENNIINPKEMLKEEVERTPSLLQVFSRISLPVVIMLLIYKLADHGLDLIWGPILVRSGINRKTILKNQFILGSLAAIIGSFLGNTITTLLKNSSLSLFLISLLRIIPNLMQLLYVERNGIQNSVFFLALHSLLENIIGSAVTACMLNFLLEKSDPKYPATSYAFMNAIALIGMSLGEFSFAQFSDSIGFRRVCLLGMGINLVFSYLVYWNYFSLSKVKGPGQKPEFS